MYNIMHKNRIIAEADETCITRIVEKDLCPACFCEGMDIEYWLKSRYIDVHRSHSRQLFKALRLKTDADLHDIISIGHGISITDNWWICRKEETDLDYRALKEYNEEIANIAFYGSPNKEYNIKGYTELGTTGSYEKTWRYINDHWYMFKQGNKAELVSEYFSFCFLKEMGQPVAEYNVMREKSALGLEQEFVISKDYTDNAKYDFEPFFNYFDDNEDYDYIIPRLEQLEKEYKCPNLVKKYVEMCFYDALLFNVDRHNQNAGFLRDSVTGKIIDLAPCYDYNLALAATKTPIFGKSGDLMSFFVKSDNCMEIIGSSDTQKKDTVKAAIDNAVKQTQSVFPNDNINYSVFSDYILNAYDYFCSALSKYPACSELLKNENEIK